MNRVTITPTIFVDARTGNKTFGVRAYDDEAQDYINTWDAIPDDDLTVLKLTMGDCGDTIGDMLDYVRQNHLGIQIGESWYEWEQIKNIFE